LTARLIRFCLILCLCLTLWPAAAPGAGPDLSLSLAVEPNVARIGQQVRLVVRLINAGARPLETAELVLEAGGRSILRRRLGPLGANQTWVEGLTWRPEGPGKIRLEARLEGPAGPRAEAWLEVLSGPTGQPDLKLRWAETPSRGCLGQGPWTAQVVVSNQGQATSAAGRVNFLVNGHQITWAELPPLAPGREQWISFSWPGARHGANTLAAELDARAARDDFSAADNRVVAGFSVEECRPDLVPVELKLLGPVEAGKKPLKAEATIANQGAGEAVQVRVRFLINGSEIYSISLARLEPGQRRPVQVTWMPPRAGTYWLRVEVDAERGVLEANENNNSRQIQVATAEARPDLQVKPSGLPANLCLTREPVLVKMIVANLGRQSSPATQAALREGPRELGRRELGPIEAKSSREIEFFWTPAKAGQYQLTLVADPDNRVAESNEDNNHQVVRVAVRDCRAELILTAPRLPASLPAGPNPGALTFRLFNSGRAEAHQVSLVLKANGQPVAHRTIDLIRPAQAVSVDFDWSPQAPGRYLIEAAADPEGRVEEADKDNNRLQAWLEVEPPAGDLRVEKVTLNPAQPQAGQPLEITAEVVNDSPRPIHDVRVDFLVNGRPAGQKMIEGMWAQGRKKVSLRLEAAPEGDLSLMVQVDPANKHPERDETNNASRLEVQSGAR